MGLLRDGEAFLNRAMAEAGGVSATYSRPATGQSLAITTAWVGRTAFSQVQGGPTSAAVIWGDRDYLIPVEDLILGGSRTTPQKGDRIREVVNGEEATFEVMAPGTEPCWRYSDAGRTRYRVHCKRVNP